MTATVEHPAETAVAVLDVSIHFDGAGRRNWPMQAVTRAFGGRAPYELLATLPASGPGSVERVTVQERSRDGGTCTYTEYRLSALAAYTAAVALLDPDSVVRGYFARQLTGAAPADEPERDYAESDSEGDELGDPEDRPIYLSDYLYAASGDAEYAERYRSAFGKAVKAAYLAEHGVRPPTSTVDIDGREAQVCQYTEADRNVIDAAWAEFRFRNRVGAKPLSA